MSIEISVPGAGSLMAIVKFCHPTLLNTCPRGSACILSPVSQQFICCEPIDVGGDRQQNLHYPRQQPAAPEEEQFEANGSGIRTRTAEAHQIQRAAKRSMLSCPNQDDQIDVLRGYPRQCTEDGRVPCRKGFLCEPSAEDPRVGVCCSEKRSPNNSQRHRNRDPTSSVLYRCPTSAQVPVIRLGQNLFCDLGQSCPSGSTCVSALNAFGMMICCRNARQIVPVCPNGMRAEPSPIGYVLCDLLQPDQCSEGFQCVHSKDDPEQNICCARIRNAPQPTSQIICPNQQVLYRDGSGPRYCSPRQQASSACPNGYSCEEAIGQSGVFVCCSIPAQPVCPVGFDASVDQRSGNPIFCSPTDMSMCAAEAQCLRAENRANMFLCCESREPGRICPQGQHALLQPNGQPEQCSGPGAPCSKPSYTCQLSYTLANRYVCCGPPGTTVLCADGRETYQQELGRTLQCNPMSVYSACPPGFECALSNVPGVNVCCRRVDAPPPTPQAPTDLPPLQQTPPSSAAVTFRPPVDELSCPVGWSAYEDEKGAHHFCQDALDMTCPHGFSCAQSSIAGIFMCCRLASSIQCPRQLATLMVNNNPRLCSIGARQTGSTSTGTAVNACPTGYTCMQSSVPAVYVCCGSSATNAGGLVGPHPPTSSSSVTGGGAIRPDIYCSDGQLPAYLGQYIRYCSIPGQSTECPPSYVCSLSNRAGLFVCCHPFPAPPPPPVMVGARRRSSSAAAAASSTTTTLDDHEEQQQAICGRGWTLAREPSRGEPMECGPAIRCPQGHRCQYPPPPTVANENNKYNRININKMFCCRPPTTSAAATATSLLLRRQLEDQNQDPEGSQSAEEDNLCPDNRDPYRPFGALVFCGPNALNLNGCPRDYVCKRSHKLRAAQPQHICCSRIAFCPADRTPQIDASTRHAKRCAIIGDEGQQQGGCAPNFLCQPSIGPPGLFVCCSRTTAAALPLRLR